MFMRADSAVCRSEGFISRARVEVRHAGRRVHATLHHATADLLAADQAGFSDSAWHNLHLVDGALVSFHHPEPLRSLAAVRGKAYGRRLDENTARSIVSDIVAGQYADAHISSFVTACTARPLDFDEVVALTGAMIDSGERIRWPEPVVVDKHSVGGLPGNRTTPVVVAIVTANGLCMPKTSSRAITSPAGKADTQSPWSPAGPWWLRRGPDPRRALARNRAYAARRMVAVAARV
ncbi:MAG: hypothetical protein FJX64_04205 [Alphaproteobacteria bacterium]|nr:hypothetical protein [Alphaproteobacteria bacterium]